MGSLQQPPPPPEMPRTNLSPFYYGLVVIGSTAIILAIHNIFVVGWCISRRGRQPRQIPIDLPLPVITSQIFNRDSSSLLISTFKNKKEGKDDECVICLSSYEDGQDVRQLSRCKHSFHASCIDMWLFSHSDFPICRTTSGNASNNHASTSIVCENGSPFSRTNVVSRPAGVPEKNRACRLLSWYTEGEIVADVVIAEADPKKLIHGMPIGFGAYKVSVKGSRVDDALLYRQTNELKCIHDVIGTYISWAKDLILLDYPSDFLIFFGSVSGNFLLLLLFFCVTGYFEWSNGLVFE
ncbi:RING-H2 finger protein ATL33-like [Papaver somniferum]|uniref:RING-H2 finger protein ATL33-like n=1 Tax=Papaver somniferum TaxID=3469 RepID=UPI000E6F934A|nr:RING-H2 finger protein ATL33-like [Papaver somniferum]